jgi:hypothetical protein
MAFNNAQAERSPDLNSATAAASAAGEPSWQWRRAVPLVAGAAQLVTISALVSADPIAATSMSLPLAVAPAVLAAAVAFALEPASLLMAVTGMAVPVTASPGRSLIPGCSLSRAR